MIQGTWSALDARNLKCTAITNNTTLASQQTHRRSSKYNIVGKFANRKVMVPSPPPPPPDYYARGGGSKCSA